VTAIPFGLSFSAAVWQSCELPYIQLYSPECTLAENININKNKQNKDRNIQINIVQLNTRYTFVNVLTKDILLVYLSSFLIFPCSIDDIALVLQQNRLR